MKIALRTLACVWYLLAALFLVLAVLSIGAGMNDNFYSNALAFLISLTIALSFAANKN